MRSPTLADLPAPPPDKSGWPWTEDSPSLPDSLLGRPWPRVSIVTPSYNQRAYIEETIRSVLLQGYPNLEYAILDGGSTDGSVEIVRKYAPWLAYWVSEPDSGQTHAINQGWTNATGDIVTYINSDDCYLQGTLASIAQAFSANPKAGMIYGSALVVDQRGRPLRVWEGRPFDLKIMLTVGSIVPQPAAFFSANVLKREGYLEEKWHMIMDYELCIRIGLRSISVCLPAIFANFRDHSQSKTRTRFEAMATELMDYLAAFAPDRVPASELRRMKRMAASRIHYEWAMTYLAQGRQYSPRAFRQLLESIFQDPLYATKRPLDTAYMMKEVMLSCFTATSTS